MHGIEQARARMQRVRLAIGPRKCESISVHDAPVRTVKEWYCSLVERTDDVVPLPEPLLMLQVSVLGPWAVEVVGRAVLEPRRSTRAENKLTCAHRLEDIARLGHCTHVRRYAKSGELAVLRRKVQPTVHACVSVVGARIEGDEAVLPLTYSPYGYADPSQRVQPRG